MDIIEQLFGISPDGGDGSTEMLYILAFVAVAAAVILRRVIRRRIRMQPS